MLKIAVFIISAVLLSGSLSAQTDDTHHSLDSLLMYDLEEVIVIAPIKTASDRAEKSLASIDEYLERTPSINMIRRGGYAWEPFINGMGTERSVVTIDGMRIYAACTDKMDPVTSYIEISNLSKAEVSSGQTHSIGGAAIAGSLDLAKKKSTFGKRKLSGASYAGFETNNLQKVFGTSLSYSHPKFFTDFDFTYRNASNYKAGGKKEIEFSQFTKYNLSGVIGTKINQNQHIEASLIYDHAIDVGYPALPMDVSSAKAFIGALEHFYHPASGKIKAINSKLYYNNIAHVMDDSQRPEVPIRMDMPGWSRTGGFFTLIRGESGKNNWKTSLTGHHNSSLAEMTMYSNDPEEKDMFMLTWPDVRTNYFDAFGEDILKVSEVLKLTFNAGIAAHHNLIKSDFGLNSLKIFYPEMERDRTRVLKRLSASLNYHKDYRILYSAGMSYGERAPSVSEGYGFYLFNSFDRYDYIGNPNLKNEKSLSFSTALQYIGQRVSLKLSANYFYIADYIIGRPDDNLSTMTIGASGVKIYEQVKQAHIANVSFDAKVEIAENIFWNNMFSYRKGKGAEVGNLPLIQPFTYLSEMTYHVKSFTANISVQGSAKQNAINKEFGETKLPAFTILNLSLSHSFSFEDKSLVLKAGAENLLDKNYTTFADWNRVPRMGRNFFFNLIWKF